MTTTNLLCSILITLTTNSVVHWPQKQIGTTHNPAWDEHERQQQSSIIHDLLYVPAEFPVYADDTNSDTRSTETTVTRMRLLSFDFEGRKFSETLTIESVAHYQVEERRVRTNMWVKLDHFEALGPMAPGVIGEIKRGDLIQGLLATNWFEPVATNALPEQAQGSFTNTILCILTNAEIYWGTAIMKNDPSLTNKTERAR
jgi:hypothetical protein